MTCGWSGPPDEVVKPCYQVLAEKWAIPTLDDELKALITQNMGAAETSEGLGDHGTAAFYQANVTALETLARENAELREKVDRNAAYYEEVWVARNQILRAERDAALKEMENLKTQRNAALVRVSQLERVVIKAAAPDFLTQAEREALAEFVQYLRSTEEGRADAV